MIRIKFLLFLFLLSPALRAQTLQHKNWPSALDKELKGKVKTWTMKNEKGIVRQQKFDENGNLIYDSYKGSNEIHIYPELLPHHIRKYAEQSYPSARNISTKDSIIKFNNKKQITEKLLYKIAVPYTDPWSMNPDHNTEPSLGWHKKLPAFHMMNKFDNEGRLVRSELFESSSRMYYTQASPSVSYPVLDSSRSVALFTYNKAGKLTEFEYYHSDIFKCVRVAYKYDENNNLIESLRYDDSNINREHFKDDYLYKIIKATEQSSFDINKYYPEFWSSQSPAKEEWKYSGNKKTEYIVYGYMGGPSFRTTWEYNEKGELIKEVHHDVYHNTIRSLIILDEQGNVIRETDHDYWEKKEYNWHYEIEYYK